MNGNHCMDSFTDAQTNYRSEQALSLPREMGHLSLLPESIEPLKWVCRYLIDDDSVTDLRRFRALQASNLRTPSKPSNPLPSRVKSKRHMSSPAL